MSISFKYAVLLSYYGTSFCGWQRQSKNGSTRPGRPSIQETIEDVIHRITRERVSVVASGRTDAGVHALGQVAHFILRSKEWDEAVLFRALNGLLPSPIRVLELQRVSMEFHAQRSALRKQYSYYFQQGPCALPFLSPFSWWIQKNLDLESMQKGLNYLNGEHDFKAFQASGAKPGSTTRKIFETEIRSIPVTFLGMQAPGFSLIQVRVVGSGFLKQMVRGIAGTLLQVGEGRRPASCFSEILRTQDRSLLGPTAPGRALWLEKVWYP